MAYRTDFGSIHQRPLGVFGAPARYVQGPGATWELGRELQRLGFQGPVPVSYTHLRAHETR